MFGKKKTGVNQDKVQKAYDALRKALGKKQASQNAKINKKKGK
jgi:hypothetical protein